MTSISNPYSQENLNAKKRRNMANKIQQFYKEISKIFWHKSYSLNTWTEFYHRDYEYELCFFNSGIFDND